MITAMMVDIEEAGKRFHELLALVAEGAEVVLTDQERPFARISPIPDLTEPRISDLHPGAFEPSDDFDAPLPDGFWLGQE